MIELYCPKCGEDAERLCEGYCESCLEEMNSQAFAAEFQRKHWESLTDKQRAAEIRRLS